jgi:PepSY-associated TM region
VKLPAGRIILYSGHQSPSCTPCDSWRAGELLFLDSEHDTRRRQTGRAVRSRHGHPATKPGACGSSFGCPIYRRLPQSAATMGGTVSTMQPRRILFWAHLCTGVVAGIVILIMCVTGVALAFERQILQIADRTARAPVSSGSARLPLETLVSELPPMAPTVSPLSPFQRIAASRWRLLLAANESCISIHTTAAYWGKAQRASVLSSFRSSDGIGRSAPSFGAAVPGVCSRAQPFRTNCGARV